MRTVFLQECESTNRVALTLGQQGAVHGTAVVAGSQTAGRGRLGRVWQSPAGRGLYCSFIVRPRLGAEEYPRLTFAAGIAVATSVEHLFRTKPGLKWPNDVYFDHRKCGGILNEASGLGGKSEDRFAIIGIGINVNTAPGEFPPEIRENATSLYLETGKTVEILDLFAEVHERLLLEVCVLEEKGFAHVLSRWGQYDFLKGKRMTWVNIHGERVNGISLGPDNSGSLYVMDDMGDTHKILSGDIELWQGKKKSAAGP